MARMRKNSEIMSLGSAVSMNPSLFGWAESIGEALGRGVARGINTGMSGLGRSSMELARSSMELTAPRRRGRPSKAQGNDLVPQERICRVEGCGREWRSKGLCSAHYQAERRRLMARGA